MVLIGHILINNGGEMVNSNSSRPFVDGFQRSQRGNLYSPAVKGALNALAKQQFPEARAMRGSV